MTKEEVVRKLSSPATRRAVMTLNPKLTRVYLWRVSSGRIKNMGGDQLDRIRSTLMSLDIMESRKQ